MMELGWNVAGMALFLIESYHLLGHMSILFRLRLLPRKDMVRIRMYFLIEMLSSFFVAVLYMDRLRWLVSVHILLHLYYFFFWEKTASAVRMISWTSLDWCQSQKAGTLEMDSILITVFDIVIHVLNVCLLGSYLSVVQIVMVLVLASTIFLAIIFNPRFAWASPKSMPAWIQKRILPLPSEKEAQ